MLVFALFMEEEEKERERSRMLKRSNLMLEASEDGCG
jgi:hypothetical protein